MTHTMTPRDTLREAVARAILAREVPGDWDSFAGWKRALAREQADAALSAIEREHVIVPREFVEAARELNAAFYASDLPGSFDRSNRAFYRLEAALAALNPK